jgi:hypothetical protein
MASVASQFMAAIPENPDEEDLVQRFVSASYVSFRSTALQQAGTLSNTLSSIRTSLLDSTIDPIAVAASPMHLTEFGLAVNHTGLSPDSCRSIALFLREPGVYPLNLPNIGSRILNQ